VVIETDDEDLNKPLVEFSTERSGELSESNIIGSSLVEIDKDFVVPGIEEVEDVDIDKEEDEVVENGNEDIEDSWCEEREDVEEREEGGTIGGGGEEGTGGRSGKRHPAQLGG
jgi:hypothetical protein